MMLTELSGMESIIDCAENLWIVGGVSLVAGAMLGAIIYHYLHDLD